MTATAVQDGSVVLERQVQPNLTNVWKPTLTGYGTAEVEILRQGADTTVVQIRISEGKNRQVRKMFEAVGHKVLKLQRTAIGDLKMAHLREGMYRKMTVHELEYLRRL